jgi:Carboxypeptidase regulatory-like domain/TonB dependent receptor
MKFTTALRCLFVFLVAVFSASVSFAQFSGGVTGVVQDATGASVPKANVVLVQVSTQVTRTAMTDANGSFNFVSLAPANYELSADAAGFAKTVLKLILDTNQNLSVTVTLSLKSVASSVEVTEQAPVLNPAEQRNQMTLEHQAVDALPVAGRSIVGLATLAPGVTGLGTGTANAPGSNVDNYSTETAVDASANGQGEMSNMWVVDGLDVTSGIRQGILNLTPNPDSVQEMGIQVNTYSSEYSRASGLETVMVTKSGTDQFHGFAADYYNNRNMYARTKFSPSEYLPFHGNNMSFGIGGPIIPHHQFFFFFDVEPLREEQSTNSGGITFADPAFVAFANANFPGTVGTGILSTFRPAGLSNVSVAQTAGTFFFGPGGCPAPQTNITVGAALLPCTTPFIDSSNFSAKALRNGTQYFGRVDKYFSKDRIYGSFYRTVLTYGAPSPIPQFSAANNQNWEYALQANWTHTFSPNTLNEAIFGVSRVEGTLGSGAAVYTVPNIMVGGVCTQPGCGDSNSTFGAGFAQGDFIQKNYHWRDVLTHVQGAHTLKFGVDGWYGEDVEPFQGPYSTPTFRFSDLTTLIQDSAINETGAMYSPLTGQPVLWSWDARSRTWGAFAMDTWKVKSNLTLTLGVRYDDSGNPWSDSPTTVFGNFYLGPGQTFQQQVANGFAKQTHNALNHAVNDLISPRIAVAWDPTGHGVWAVRAGFGIYNNWLTSANIQEEFRGNPPGLVQPTFLPNGVPGVSDPLIFQLGTKNTPGFGFPSPGFTAGLDGKGGIAGLNFNIGGINPNIESPQAAIWSGTVERSFAKNLVASVGYTGSHSYNLVSGGDVAGGVSYGVNINSFPGDLVQNNSFTPTRLNTSFGAITYADNVAYGNYNAVIFDVRGRFSHAFFDASYTRSESRDDAGVYPTAINPAQYYGPSPWDAPNRFSLTFNYQLPGLNGGQDLLGHLTGGWGLTGTSIFQSGYPFTVINQHPFAPLCASAGGTGPCPSATNPITGLAPNSGDYNADGTNYDYPNVSSYAQATSKAAFLNGVFQPGQFTQPAISTEGNEKQNAFRGPNFAETDLAIYKDNRFKERFNFQVRFEFYNIFNRTNLENMDTDPLDPNFGKATGQLLGRWWQIGGRFTF